MEKIIELFPIYGFDISVARVYAELWSDLSKKSIQIGAHDLIISSDLLFYFIQLPKDDFNDIASCLSVGKAQHANNEMTFS